MALWQFITVIALVGALVVLAGVIARKLGLANARLTRIEEALLARSLPIDAADLSAAEAKPEVPGEKEVRGPYLTLRDLRARSEQLSSPASASSGWNCVTERGEAPTTTSGEQPGLERPPVLATDSEPLSLPTLEPVSEAAAGAGVGRGCSAAAPPTPPCKCAKYKAGSTEGYLNRSWPHGGGASEQHTERGHRRERLPSSSNGCQFEIGVTARG